MRRCIILTCGLILVICAAASAANISRSTEDRLKQLEQRAAKTAESIAREYSKEWLDAANVTVAAAKAAVAAGREKEALQKMELAEVQLRAADVKAAEKELLEKVALSRAELKKLEAQLEQYRQGGGN